MTLREQGGSTSPAGIQICGKGSTAWRHWYSSSSIWTRSAIHCSCSAATGGIKGLYWEGDGFVLVTKRLEAGSFQWPRNSAEARQLSYQQYRWLMEGLQIDQPKAHRRVVGLSMV